jgi:hypothetical protein
MIDAIRIEGGSAAFDAMNDIALLQQELSQIGAVLAGDSRNQRSLLQFPLPLQTLQMIAALTANIPIGNESYQCRVSVRRV